MGNLLFYVNAYKSSHTRYDITVLQITLLNAFICIVYLSSQNRSHVEHNNIVWDLWFNY